MSVSQAKSEYLCDHGIWKRSYCSKCEEARRLRYENEYRARCEAQRIRTANISFAAEFLRHFALVGILAAICLLGAFLDHGAVLTWMTWGGGIGLFVVIADLTGRLSGRDGLRSGPRPSWRRKDPFFSWLFDCTEYLIVGAALCGALRTLFLII